MLDVTFWVADCNSGYGGCRRNKRLRRRDSLVCAQPLQVRLQGAFCSDIACVLLL